MSPGWTLHYFHSGGAGGGGRLGFVCEASTVQQRVAAPGAPVTFLHCNVLRLRPLAPQHGNWIASQGPVQFPWLACTLRMRISLYGHALKLIHIHNTHAGGNKGVIRIHTCISGPVPLSWCSLESLKLTEPCQDCSLTLRGSHKGACAALCSACGGAETQL